LTLLSFRLAKADFIDAASDDFSIIRYAERKRVARLGIDGNNLTETDDDCKKSDEKYLRINLFHKIEFLNIKKHQQNTPKLPENQAKRQQKKLLPIVLPLFFGQPFR
jgi:hypothetical protein